MENFIGYDPIPIAQEVINIFAKYKIPIKFKNSVYQEIDYLLSCQNVVPIEQDNTYVRED